MISIIDLINKIRWDKKEHPEDYTIAYEDRIKKELIEIPYTKIKKLEGTFMIIDQDDEETNIPTHRIKQVKKKGEIIWQR